MAAGQAPDDNSVEPAKPVPYPQLVVLSEGNPKTVLKMFGFKRERRGLCRAPEGCAVRIVVLSELPRTRATVLMRLGSRKQRAEAVDQLLHMPADAWERRTAEPILVQYNFIPRAGDSPEETMLGSEILKKGQEIIRDAERRGEDRGKREGERKGERKGKREGKREGACGLLLKLLRLRFGKLSKATVARVEAAEPEELDRWAERVLSATSLSEVLGDS